MVTIKIKENSKQAKMFVAYAKTLPYVEFITTPKGLVKPKIEKETDPYNPKFVAMIKKRIAKDKFTPISTESIWESIK